MSLRKYNRKRRRSQAFPDEQNEEQDAVELEQTIEEEAGLEVTQEQPPEVMSDEPGEANMNGGGEADDETPTDAALKEQAVWEVFCEEHYEVLEQLPLSLHRAYTLLGELDEQVNTGNTNISQQIQKYIAMRQAVAKSAVNGQIVPTDAEESSHDKTSSPEEHVSLSESPSRESPPPLSPTKRPKVRSRVSANGHSAKAGRDFQRPAPSAPSPPPPETTRSVIASFARLSEDVMRAANEKLNVARFACDLIDRYIRDMDREIKEQETSLSLGLRPGTHPATIVLPEVVLPKTSRAARIQETPFSDEFETPQPEAVEPEGTPEAAEVAEGASEVPVEANTAAAPHPPPRKRSRRSHGWSKKKTDHKEREQGKLKEMEQEAAEPLVVLGEEENVQPQAQPPPQRDRSVTRLTVTLPPLASLQQPQLPLEPIAVDEERYCYCNGISYGEMVGCDGCDGWFHLGCIDEKTIPKGKWYCRDCAPTKGHGRPRAKHTRKKR